MSIGLVGRKCGMMRLFDDKGNMLPVTVVEVLPNKITQLKKENKEGYNAVQITTGTCKLSRLSKALAGHFSKANIEAGRGLWEFLVSAEEIESFKLGEMITISLFSVGQKVDVSGITKGKGFQGKIKRWNGRRQPESHGNSLSHRVLGSTGQNQTPGRVFPGKHMPGHLGDEKKTMQSLEVIKIDESRNLILIKGSLPGAKGGDVVITFAEKFKSV